MLDNKIPPGPRVVSFSSLSAPPHACRRCTLSPFLSFSFLLSVAKALQEGSRDSVFSSFLCAEFRNRLLEGFFGECTILHGWSSAKSSEPWSGCIVIGWSYSNKLQKCPGLGIRETAPYHHSFGSSDVHDLLQLNLVHLLRISGQALLASSASLPFGVLDPWVS